MIPVIVVRVVRDETERRWEMEMETGESALEVAVEVAFEGCRSLGSFEGMRRVL